MVSTNLGAEQITPRPISDVPSDNAPVLTYAEPLFDLLDFDSKCPDDSVRAGERLDPYWSDLWPVGAKASWVSIGNARSQVAAGVKRLPAYLRADPDEAESKLADPVRLPTHLNILSVLDSWRGTTSEQLAAFTGHKAIAKGKSRIMTDLFTTDLVDVGIFANALFNTTNTDRGSLYRANTTGTFNRKIAPNLTYAEWVSTTAGLDNKSAGGLHDRHNIIAAEVALRIAELCDIGTVVGEKLSTADLLGYTSVGEASRGPRYSRSADLTVIREDGAKIAVEITANAGTSFEAKVQHWADLLSTRRMDDCGLAVLFVLVDRQDGKISRNNNVRNTVYRIVREVVRNTPGVNFDRVASRMGIADYREWFPAPGKVSPSFFELDCDRPTGPAGAGLWERASLLSNDDLPFHPEGTWAAESLDNLSILRSTPHWLRRGRTAPELWPVLLRAAKLTKIPVPLLSQPQIARGTREFGKKFGFVAATLPPRRVRVRG
jgi:hypothetical protein